ncbi:MAG: hypothetical protein LC689_16590, partial [Myxococcales bacterium]|nr:hypothetical protein [Myxococcales bacterium]
MKAFKSHVLAIAMVAAAAGCKKPLTYVHVQIAPAANEPSGITRIDLQMTLGDKSQNISLSDPGGAELKLPTDVTLQIGSGTGQLAITAVATNAAGAEVDRGVTTADVKTGAIAQATVQLPGGKPVIVPAEAQHGFSAVSAGQQSSPVTISFQNKGFQPSGSLSVALGGAGAAQFGISATTCTGTQLAPGATCTVTLVFKPVIDGPIAATLTVSGTPGGDTVVALTGTGNPNPQVITVTLSGTGQGSINSKPTGVTCATGPCVGTFTYGASVTLTAAPATGSHFVGWGGDCSGTGTCTLSMIQARAATARFDFDSEHLDVGFTGAGSGTITSADTIISCTTGTGGTCANDYNYNTVVTLTAANAFGSHFVQWSDASCAATNPCNLTMTAAASVTAQFDLDTNSLSVAFTGNAGGGTVTSEETPTPLITCSSAAGGNCVQPYAFGTSVTLDAAPDGVSAFVKWSFASVSGTPPTCDNGNATTPCHFTFSPDADTTVTAQFDHLPELVTVTVNGNGSGSVNGTGGISNCTKTAGTGTCAADEVYGSTVALTASPATGSSVSWTGCPSPSGNTCTITAISAPANVTATFTLNKINVTLATGGNGSGSVGIVPAGTSCGANCHQYDYGTGLTITATPNTGSSFTSFSGESCSTTIPCTTTATTTATVTTT